MRSISPLHRLSGLVLGGVIVIALALPSGADASAPRASKAASASKAKLPPALLALERKMQSLHINSERGRVNASISGVSLGPLLKGSAGKLIPGLGSVHGEGHSGETNVSTGDDQRLPYLTATFETSQSPKLADVREVLLGELSFQERTIGEQSYVSSSLFTDLDGGKLDGGKRWVSVSAAEMAEEKAKSKQSQSSSVSGLGDGEADEAGFRKLAVFLRAAQSVREVGAGTVDGQQTTEFEGGVDAKRLLGDLSKGSKDEKKALKRAKARFEIYIAANGLPVRTKLQIDVGKASIDEQSDILATEIPISVTPPPASETITEAELKQHEEPSEQVATKGSK